MRVSQTAFTFLVISPVSWSADWAWGLPLIVVTVVIHVLGLGFIRQGAASVSSDTH